MAANARKPASLLLVAGGVLVVAGLLALLAGFILLTRALEGDAEGWGAPDLKPSGIALSLGSIAIGLGAVLFSRVAAQRRSSVAVFLNPAEEDQVLDAIEAFEQRTSGELRVHLEPRLLGELMDEAKRAFEKLGLTATRERNAVLFFVAVREHRFAVLGDTGIDQKVPPGFWAEVVDHVQREFSHGRFAEGLVEGIRMAGEALAQHFPPRPDDVNELPNQLSRG